MIYIYTIVIILSFLWQSQALSCSICMAGAALLSQSYRVLPHSTMVSLMKAACMKQLDSDLVCQSLSKQLTPVILPSVWWRVFNPEVFCGQVGWCPIKYKPLNLPQELQRIASIPQQQQKQKQPSTSAQNKRYKLLQLSDIHLDVDYRQGYSSICKQTVCCHEEHGTSSNSSQNAGYYGNYRCDAPETLLDSAVKNIQILQPDIDLVLLTGDLSAHNQWEKSPQNNAKIVNKVISKFKDWSAPVLLALGNNECYPDHQFDPTMEITLKNNLADSMNRYLTSEQLKTLSSKGYYSKAIPQLGLTIIALNSLVCDDTNFYLIANITDPSDQLKWLEKQLIKVQQSSSSAFIISHISPGINQCSHTWTKIYRALSARFNSTIKGHFYGHTHNDQFVVLTNPLNQEPVGSIFQAPALSPVSNHQPSFRVYEIDATTHQILNYRQYSSNLAQANMDRSVDMHWVKTYDFVAEYQLENMRLQSVVNLQSRLNNDARTLDTYRSHLDGGHSSNSGNKGAYCDTLDDRDSQYKCKGMSPEDDKVVYLMQLLQGQWLQRV